MKKFGMRNMMKKLVFCCKGLLVISVIAVLTGQGFAATSKRPRPGSFVRYAVESVQQLVDHVSVDDVVAKRYSKFFKVPEEQLICYLRNNLKVIPLPRPIKVKMHFVGKNGAILSRNCWLPSGHKVFATAGDIPVLDIGCGNPLTEKLPPIESKVKGVTQVVSADFSKEEAMHTPEGAYELSSETEPQEMVLASVITPSVQEEAPLLRLAEPLQNPPSLYGAFEPGFPENITSLSLFQLARGLVPAFALLASSSDRPRSEPTPPPVPEPAVILSVLLGTASLVLRQSRQHS